MKVIGIIGGVASGKSTVAEGLRKLGAAVIDADAVGHAVLREPDVEQQARARWGDAIFGADGHIDRGALSRIVFGPQPGAADELRHLEQLTHPRIAQRLREQIDQFAAAGKHHTAVLDAAVLLKAGWSKICYKIIFVDTPREIRLARGASRGWSLEDFSRRENAQEPLPEKRAQSDVIIDNSGPFSDTQRQLEQFWHSLFPGVVAD